MKNWTVKEAVLAIKEGKDIDGIQEIAKHFPMFFKAVCENDMVAFAMLTTDKFTLNRLAKVPTGVGEVEADEDAEDQDVTEESTDKGSVGENLLAMSTKELIALCGKRGIKVPKYGKNKQFYLDALGNGDEEEAEEAEAEEAEDRDEDPYAGKSAKELFEMCKKAGIKVAPKQASKVYIKALEDAKAANDEADGDEDDWGEEEDEAPAKPVKTAKKADKKPVKKTATKAKAKAEADEDEDEDEDGDSWDI